MELKVNLNKQEQDQLEQSTMARLDKLRDILEHGNWVTREQAEEFAEDQECPVSNFITMEDAEVMNLKSKDYVL